jgi:hypothetical protein
MLFSGNEQENPDFVAQVVAMEARRAAPGVQAPTYHYMYPTNSGVSNVTASSLAAAGVSAADISMDCHVGGGGGIGCAVGDWDAMPGGSDVERTISNASHASSVFCCAGFKQMGINCETNAGISTVQRAMQVRKSTVLEPYWHTPARIHRFYISLRCSMHRKPRTFRPGSTLGRTRARTRPAS